MHWARSADLLEGETQHDYEMNAPPPPNGLTVRLTVFGKKLIIATQNLTIELDASSLSVHGYNHCQDHSQDPIGLAEEVSFFEKSIQDFSAQPSDGVQDIQEKTLQ